MEIITIQVKKRDVEKSSKLKLMLTKMNGIRQCHNPFGKSNKYQKILYG